MKNICKGILIGVFLLIGYSGMYYWFQPDWTIENAIGLFLSAFIAWPAMWWYSDYFNKFFK